MVDERDNNGNQPENQPEELPAEDAIEIVPEDTATLQKELEESRMKANEYLEGWQRARADFANYKKRVDRDQAQVYQNAAGSILKRYIEILDDLERALNHRPKEGEGVAWSEGIELIYRK
ncbi:MAG TPA: nucleotide exchange factor GrpE, partial [Anaerolineales bacterium]